MSANNSKPKPPNAPVVTLHEEPSNLQRYLLFFVPAILGSIIFHVVLLGIFFLLAPGAQADASTEISHTQMIPVSADPPPDEKREPFTTVDVDPAIQEADVDIAYNNSRIEEISVPGSVNPDQAVGILNASKEAPPVSLPAPGGFGVVGQGGAIQTDLMLGNSNAVGQEGGYSTKGLPLQGSFYGRSGATKEKSLRDGGGTGASEAAVARGLKWLVRQQMPDGKWMLNSPSLPDRDRGTEANDIAATALGLLPLLAAGKTHVPAADNPYDKNVDKALKYLVHVQNQQTGFFGGTMYSHGLASIAMCEAYGLTQDPRLRRSAQLALGLIISVQHERGGWRYGASKQEGDLSVAGWQMMALKSGQMAGLDVPNVTIQKSIAFLNSCCTPSDKGYGYTGPGSSPRMTAVGLLCRQYMQRWGPATPDLVEGVKILRANPPRQDVYYYYYATQVMHHFGGDLWTDWNNKMREFLIAKQEQNNSSPNFGSWSPEGDPFGRVGGRLMMTSLNLLTLEVYYRYLPLYYRDAGAKADAAVQKAQ